MPKVNLFKNAYEELTKDIRELPSIIKAKQGYFRMSNRDVATAAGVTERTMSNRYHNPEQFTLAQLAKLCKKLKFEVVINENGVQCRFERGDS